MSDRVAIAYPDVATAQTVAGNLGEAIRAHDIELDDLVVVERQGDGQGEAPPAIVDRCRRRQRRADRARSEGLAGLSSRHG